MKWISAARNWLRAISTMESRLARIQESLGRIESRQVLDADPPGLRGKEFRVFSQWGEDGILQFLTREVPIERRAFIEFGVENYVESNTRFLLVNDDWSGLVIDGSADNIRYIREDPIYWRHNLKAECRFVTRENIDRILLDNGMSGEVGLLSIDIDGNDYWVWKEITAVSAAIVVVEYNARLGPEAVLTVPYDPAFVRAVADGSNIFYGASLAALRALGREKGYTFVGCNSSGNNAFFVRDDLMSPALLDLASKARFVANQFREARGADGALLYLDPEAEQAMVRNFPWVDPTASTGGPA